MANRRIPVLLAGTGCLSGVTTWSEVLRDEMRDSPRYDVQLLYVGKNAPKGYDLAEKSNGRALELVRSMAPAVVVPNYLWELYRAGSTYGIQCLGMCHSDSEQEYYHPLSWYEPHVSQFIAVSDECGDRLKARVPHRKKDVTVLPYGVRMPESLARNYQVEPIRIVYAGRITQYQKRVRDFVPLVAALVRRGTPFTFDLFGDGDERESLQAELLPLAPNGAVRFHGCIPHSLMASLWGSFDVFVQVSDFEGTSVSMLEAMGSGVVPVVTAASSGVATVIEDGRNGRVLPIGDMESMAGAISDLASDEHRLARYGAEARVTGEAYSLDSYIERFVKVLDRAVDGYDHMNSYTRYGLYAPTHPLLKLESALKQSRIGVYKRRLRKLSARLGSGLNGLNKLAQRAALSYRSPVIGDEATSTPWPAASVNTAPSLAASGRKLTLVTAADDNYALPLAAMVRSVLDHLDPAREVQLFVLDGGLTESSRSRLAASWDDPRLQVEWAPVAAERLRRVPVNGHVTASTYSRLLIPDLLPSNVKRALYLDADVIVRRDLGALWDKPLGGALALAVQDQAAPLMHAGAHLAWFDLCRRFLASATPVANYRELGIPSSAPYFNGGVFIADIAAWRREGITERAFEVLDRHREHVLWWDQYALNVVLAGRWSPLDARWNQGAHAFIYPTWRRSPYTRDAFKTLRRDPWIVHFCSPDKPWRAGCAHPYADEFHEVLRRTAWSDFRLTPPERTWKAWWSRVFERRRKVAKGWLQDLFRGDSRVRGDMRLGLVPDTPRRTRRQAA